MHYHKKETYSFAVPGEYKDYLDFKQKLDDAGISYFAHSSGTLAEVVEIHERGCFDIKDGLFTLVKEG